MMTNARVSCKQARHQGLRRMFHGLLVTALLMLCGGVQAQASGADQATGTPELLQRQGLQQQRLIQGLAATQSSQTEAKRLAAGAHAAAPRKPVSQADVLTSREEKIRCLNASKVDHSASP